jgi:tetratricopeptide (TPR) repeat protein
MRKFNTYVILVLLMILAACSSAPKRPEARYTTRNMALTQLELAGQAADQGDYDGALVYLTEARRLAVSADNSDLLVRVGLAQGNSLFSLGRFAEADAVWEGALAEAERAGDRELAAICRIYQARALLLRDGGQAEGVQVRVETELGAIKNDRLSLALGWTVIGLAEKERRRWTEAENALKKALDIHEKDRYLEQAAYDWYLIASVRSVAGRYAPALEALETALTFDRRGENTYGLGMDWLAMGDVHTKAGQGREAAAAYRRAAEIFDALAMEKEAASARLLGGELN